MATKVQHGYTSTMETVLTRKPNKLTKFSSLMELYENNYMLIRLLVPDLKKLVGELSADSAELNDADINEPKGTTQSGQVVYVSQVDGCLDLELSRIEHNRYTSTFNLTYRFTNDLRNPREPDLTVRIYHDARTCEVMSGLLQGLKHGPLRRRDLHEGYRLNRFLSKWVKYCLKQGHCFKSGHYLTRVEHDVSGDVDSASCVDPDRQQDPRGRSLA